MIACTRREPRSRTVAFLLAALLLWSFVLRVWYASFELDAGRFFDERYSFANAQALLEGSLRPANGWYPSLAHLPQTALLALSDAVGRITGAEIFEISSGGGLSPTAYFLARLMVAVYGALTLALTFLLGRWLFSPQVGLVAALLLSVVPAHIRLSAYFKPDMLLLLLVLATFLLTLSVVEHPTLGRWLTAGAAVGLACSSKLNGIAAALPVAVTGLVMARRSRRQLLHLAASGLASGAVFLALNPYVGLYLDHLRRNARIYEERAMLQGIHRFEAPLRALELLASPGFHGIVIATLAVVGLLGLGVAAVRHRRLDSLRSLGYGLLPVFTVFYLAVLTLAARYPKPNNFLQVTPFTSLAAAWLLVGLWQRLELRLPPLQTRAAVTAGGLVLAGLLLPPAHVYAYRTAVPTTAQLARETLQAALHPLAGRTVLCEGIDPPRLLNRREAAAVVSVEDLSRLPAADLDLSDALLLRRRRLPELASEPLGHRLAGAGDAVIVLEPAFGRVRGPALVLLLQAWELTGHHRMDLPRLGASAAVPIPPEARAEPGSRVSLQLLIRGPDPPGEIGLRLAGEPLPLTRTRLEIGGYLWGHAYTSPRVQTGGASEISVLLPDGFTPPKPPRIEILSWHPPPPRP